MLVEHPVTPTDTREPQSPDLGSSAGLVALPDDPGETVCRSLLAREDAVLELGVAEGDPGCSTVYLVTMEHCTHLSPPEARAAAEHLLRAAAEAETRGS